jgi:hypothetical protein
MARLRSRLNWLKEGDANTSYFHHHTRYRNRKNFIAKVKDGHRIIIEQEGKKESSLVVLYELARCSRPERIHPQPGCFSPARIGSL